jgi:hypothetical protein
MFKDVIISNLISLPKTMVCGIICNIPILGRKYSMALSFVGSALFALFLIVNIENAPIYSGLLKLIHGVTMGIVKIYTTEAYPTKIRGLGYGSGHSICRIAGCICAFICEILRYIFNIYTPYGFMLIISLIACYSCIKLPFETLGRELDKHEEEDIIEVRVSKSIE